MKLIRRDLVLRIFLSVLAAFLAMFIFQVVILNRNVDAFYLRHYQADAGRELLRTATLFVNSGFDPYAVSDYVQKNGSPVLVVDDKGTLYNTDIFSGYSVLSAHTLRGKPIYLLADYLADYSDRPLSQVAPGSLLRARVVRIGQSDFFYLNELRTDDQLYINTLACDFYDENAQDVRFCLYQGFTAAEPQSEINARRRLLFETLHPLLASGSLTARLSNDIRLDDSFGNSYTLLSKTISAGGRDLTFVTMLPVTDSNLLFQYLSGYYIYLYAFFLVVIIALSYWFARSISSPLVHLSEVAERMALLDFRSRACIRSPDQLGKLSDSLNTLSDNLQNAIQALETANETIDQRFQAEKESSTRTKILLEDMAHEFKTPLGIISGFSELVEYGLCEQDRSYYFHVIKSEIAKLSELVDDTIDLSKMSTGHFPFDYVQVDIAVAVLNITDRLRYEIERNGFTLSLDLVHANVRIDEKRMSQVFYNLFSNIFKYASRDDKTITLSARVTAPGEVTIRIENRGVLSQDELTRIFNRYQTGPEPLGRKVRRSGIGLEIVKRILTLHGSSYGFEAQDDRICFYFTLHN